MMWRIALVDDEAVQIELLKKLLKEYGQAHEVSFQFLCFESAEAFLFHFEEDKAIDLLVLDIEMDGMNGLELAHLLREKNQDIKLLFVTGYTDYMADGYEVSAMDYILKPVDRKKLHRVLNRFKKSIPKKEETLVIETAEEKVKINQADIMYLEADGHRTIVKLMDKKYEALEGIGVFKEKVSADLFVQSHRSYLVNLDHIKRISKTDIYMDDHTLVPVSRRLYKKVNEAFIQHFKEGLIQ